MLFRLFIVLYAAAALVMGAAEGRALARKPNIMKGCMNCHKAEPDRVRGKLVSFSPKFSSLHVDVGPLVWIIRYDRNTEISGADSLDAIARGKEISIIYSGDENNPRADLISVKQPFHLPEKKLVSVEEMRKLARTVPKEGRYLLVDSRPPDAYNAGHLPGAVSIPYPKLDTMREALLPSDKDARIIFYCGGFS